jgi:hypothetical protein
MAWHKVYNSQKRKKQNKTRKKNPGLYPNPFNIVEHLQMNS